MEIKVMAEYIYTRVKLVSGQYDIDTSYGPKRLIHEIYVTLPAQKNVKTISDGIQLKIITETALSVEDEAVLNGIVATHKTNNANAIKPTPYKLTGTYEDPKLKNLNVYGLYRKDTIDSKGSLVLKEYYKTYDGNNYSDLVAKDEYIYSINAYDLVSHRDEIITWYREDGTIGSTKTIKKYYDLNKGIKEGMSRRTNLLDIAKAYGLGNITGTHASGLPNSYYWFSTMNEVVDHYLNGTLKQNIIDFIDNETETYVTQTIKDTMTSILDYWTV
jgi:hypothetical protein